MLTASRLKKTNICEYLLYMWQVEDMIRALKFDMDTIEKVLVNQGSYKDAAERKQVLEWYESLIDMMRSEHVADKGHIQLNKNVLIDLEEVHLRILKSGLVPAYTAKFFHVLPLIGQLRRKSDAGLSDLELCFNFQYGILLLKLQKKEISAGTLQTQEEIAKFMVLLAGNYHAYTNGELDLE
ncbi:MAG: DUF4924 family protein [Bacteroidales bacterium]|jgi:hypothetical protein|nr:DUF4924 family protein [Bacteroidales bacterium]OJX91734.1 MAG: DUF4924 domain-containing protein [Paludibacter sp. 47-17]